MIGDKNTPLSQPEAAKTRTDFKKQPIIGGMNLTSDEKKVYEYVMENRTDVAVFCQSKTAEWLMNWIKGSLDYYKDVLSVNENEKNDPVFRGIIQGQREIVLMLAAIMRTWKNKKGE